ncbi:MAG: type II toxin-antitoxin system HipA family toxin [Acidobacteria bacterium]|nr:type II toxin-antitoxin system HipA family toxin [Acidobacteriota bacterium]
MSREIHVYADWEWLGEIRRMGLLRADVVRGEETFSFEYDPEWLTQTNELLLDPELVLFEGPQYPADKVRSNFGLFLDSSPDRWGRLIMKRRESVNARIEGREPRRLFESDFLLGVHDEQRMGGLRFKESPDGDFLSAESGMTAPPMARLRELEHAAWKIQEDDRENQNDEELSEWLALLMAPGSSIGGARPKAGVVDEKDQLWIAKFPARGDEYDIGAWEMVVHRLAQNAGLDVAESRLEKFGLDHHTFLTKRFDRVVIDGKRHRRHFASAMTMLGYSDGTSFADGASYLEIVEFLMKYGADVDEDLKELFRRIVFSICVSNTDDHLRNHGFMLLPNGWKLAPAYDINPNPFGTGLHLNISENDNSLNLELAREVAPYFRISDGEARMGIQGVVQVVRCWRKIASKLGISNESVDSMQTAFDV